MQTGKHKHKRKYKRKRKQSKRILDICSTGLMSDDDAPFIINLKWFRAVGARFAVRTHLLGEVTTQRLNARLHHWHRGITGRTHRTRRTRRTACIRIARSRRRICVSPHPCIRLCVYTCEFNWKIVCGIRQRVFVNSNRVRFSAGSVCTLENVSLAHTHTLTLNV